MPENPIKRVKIENPDGTTTYRDTWFKSSPSKSSSGTKPVNNATLVRQTKSVSKPPSVSSYSSYTPRTSFSSSREVTTIKPIKSVGMTSQKITAPLPELAKKPVTKREISENTHRYQESVWLKNNPGKTLEDRAEQRAKYVKEAQNKPREKYQSEGSLRGAKRSSRGSGNNPCKTC